MVVVGDRREHKPQTCGDLLAYSASSVELLHFCRLGLQTDTLIYSDKIFTIHDPDTLREIFTSYNILTIGSPAANLFSRQINDSSLIRFDINARAKAHMRIQEEIVRRHRLDEVALCIYKCIVEQSAQTPDDFERQMNIARSGRIDSLFEEIQAQVESSGILTLGYRAMLRMFTGDAILNPIKNGGFDLQSPTRSGFARRQTNDFGFVSLARHPFSDKRVVIYAAGVHGPATTQAVALLAEHNQWEQRPMGDVFEVYIPTQERWGVRLRAMNHGWDRPQPYGKREFDIDSLPRSVSSSGSVFFSTKLRQNDAVEKQKTIAVSCAIERTLDNQHPGLRCLQPYALPHTGWNYVEGILRFFAPALAIVHNVTELSEGVMFEVGCSIGLGKTVVLVWDKQEGTPTPALPALLERTQVIQVDLSRPDDVNRLAAAVAQAISSTPMSATPVATNAATGASLLLATNDAAMRENVTAIAKDEHRIIPQVAKFNQPAELYEQISGASAVLVDVEHGAPECMIALGIARSIEKNVIALSTNLERPSMFDGTLLSVHQDTMKQDVRKAIKILLERGRV